VETHWLLDNSYTQASAECGIPGFIFFTGGILSTFLLFAKTLKQARKRPGCQDIAVTVFCVMLGMAGFVTAIAFLNFGYYFYLPALASLSIGMWDAAQREFERRGAALPSAARPA